MFKILYAFTFYLFSGMHFEDVFFQSGNVIHFNATLHTDMGGDLDLSHITGGDAAIWETDWQSLSTWNVHFVQDAVTKFLIIYQREEVKTHMKKLCTVCSLEKW